VARSPAARATVRFLRWVSALLAARSKREGATDSLEFQRAGRAHCLRPDTTCPEKAGRNLAVVSLVLQLSNHARLDAGNAFRPNLRGHRLETAADQQRAPVCPIVRRPPRRSR